MIDWGGAQRWLVDPDFNPRARLTNGHATLMLDRDSSGIPPFSPLPAAIERVHKAVKAVLDPAAILNRGRMYAEI
jgi:glycolate oxidase FAD binding subunit